MCRNICDNPPFIPHDKSMKPRILSSSIASNLSRFAFSIALVGGSYAAPIVFGPAQTVTTDTDVLNVGLAGYAYTLANVAQTVNGVAFTGSNSVTSLGGNVTLAAATLTNNVNAFGSGTGNPYGALSAGYKGLLAGGNYTNAATPITLTLNNLIVGHNYATQIWVNDNRSGIGDRRVAVTGGGGNSVTLDYNTTATNAAGGVGQFSIGLFNANATSQAFTVTANVGTSSQFNSMQLRDVTNIGYWTGTGGAAWDAATTANFASNIFSAALTTTDFATAKAPLKAVTFADAYWNSGATVAVTQNTVNIAAGGVTTGIVQFQNTGALGYTVNSSDSLGITGATQVAVTGGGTVTLNGAHSYTGETAVLNGTLKVGAATTFNNTGALSVGPTGLLDLNGNNAAFTTLSGAAGGTITDTGAAVGTTTLAFSNAAGAAVGITNGATRAIALRVTNQNGGFFLTNGANTFSGGLVLTNSASGTRMAPGTITAGAYGTGPITVGEAATDRAGIFFATANQTLSNPIIANTGLGTDRVGTFRVAATGITLSGQLTAGLADVTFSTNETGSVTATGKITGNNGLKLLSHTLGGTLLTVTLNNAAQNNDYSGNTTINENPQAGRSYTLALGAPNQIPNGAGKGNVIINTNGTGVGRLNLGGFSETINGLDGTGTLDGVSGSPVLTVGDGNANGSFSGTIVNAAGTLALTKTGSGTQTLGGANTYSGPTQVSNGKLFVNGSLAAASAVTVASGATLGGTGTVSGTVSVASGGRIESGTGSAAGTLTLASLTLGATAGDTSILNLRAFGSPAVNVTGTDLFVANGGTSSATVNIIGSAPALGTYTLIDYAGTALSPAAYASFAIGTLPNRVTANLVNNSSNTSIDLNVTLVDTARWSGALGNEWSTATLSNPKNWVLNSDGTTGTDYLQNDTVSFTDSATATVVDVSAANVNPASMTFDHSSKNYTLQGTAAITGTTGLTKLGTGKLTITSTNSFSGPVAIQRGVVSVGTINNGGTNSPIGTAAGVSLGDATNSGTLEYTGLTAATNRTLSLNAGGGAIAVTGVGTTLTLNGAITGTGAFTKAGPGNLELNATNTFSGGFNITGGIVKPLQDAALGAAGSLISVASGASLDINSRTLQGYTQNISIAGTGADAALGALGNSGATDNVSAIRGITLTGDASIGGNGGRWDIGRIDFNGDPAITVNHIEGGGFTLTKVGSNYLGLLTGANNLAGFIINGGTVAPHENTSFGTGPVTVNNGAILRPWGANITIGNNVTINAGTLQSDGQNNFYAGTVTIAGPTTLNAATGGNIQFNGAVSGAGPITKTGPFSVILNGNGSGYTGTYTNSQSNTFFNSATSSSVGATFVLDAGIVANTTAGTVTHDLGAFGGAGGSLGNNVAASAVTFSIGALNTNTSFAGTIVDSVGGGGTTAITKVGNGILTLSGVNTFSGPLVINGGTVAATAATAGNASAIGAGTNPITVNAGGTLLFATNDRAAGFHSGPVNINGGTITANTNDISLGSANTITFDTAPGVLNGTGQWRMRDTNVKVLVTSAASGSSISVADLRLTTPGGGVHTFDVADGTQSVDLTVSSAINQHFGGEAVRKDGAGTLLFSGTNTYSGPTTVNAGTLIVNGSISGSATTVIGGTIAGSGTLGALTVIAGATVSPGNGPGILTAGNTILATGSTLSIDINGTSVGTGYDQLNVGGTIDLTGATLTLSGSYSGVGSLFTILLNNDTDPVVGTFAGLSEGALVVAGGGQQYNISYAGGDGNDVVLSSIPEPGSAALLLGGIALLASRRRQRR